MPWGAAAAAAVVGGSIIQGNKAAGAARDAANAQREAGERAAQFQQFRPVGITTGFGSSEFTQGPYGVESAKYTLTPEMQALRDRRIAEATAYDPTQLGQYAQPLYGAGQKLFGLGQQYLATSPEEAAQQYMSQQQGLLASSRAADLSRVGAANFGRGTGGLGVNTGTGGAPSNPLAQALFNAQARQDLELAARADEAGMARTRFGADLYNVGGGLMGRVPSLMSAGYGPLQTQLGLAGSIEEMGQQALGLGLQVGGQNAAAGGRAGQSLLASGMAAAQTQQAANSWSPWGTALQGLGQSYMGGAFKGMGGAGSTPQYTGPSYGTNPNFSNSWFDTMSYD
jgi:hypothetical protein